MFIGIEFIPLVIVTCQPLCTPDCISICSQLLVGEEHPTSESQKRGFLIGKLVDRTDLSQTQVGLGRKSWRFDTATSSKHQQHFDHHHWHSFNTPHFDLSLPSNNTSISPHPSHKTLEVLHPTPASPTPYLSISHIPTFTVFTTTPLITSHNGG